MLSATMARIRDYAPEQMDEQARRRLEKNVTNCAREFDAAGRNPDVIDRRLRDLDREWDIDRTLEVNAAAISLVGLALAVTVNRRWVYLPTGIAAFLLLHAVRGWCPPASVLRSAGVRTAEEIDRERYALKALRGDFGGLTAAAANAEIRAQQAVRAACRSVPS